jgi:hypothetical protein
MAAAQESQFLKQASGPNTRGLLRVIILCLIAGAAVSSRLFSVIRFESIIHECWCTVNGAWNGQLANGMMQSIHGSISVQPNTWSSMASTSFGIGSMTVRTSPLSLPAMPLYHDDDDDDDDDD